jgi:hypothetical protein
MKKYLKVIPAKAGIHNQPPTFHRGAALLRPYEGNDICVYLCLSEVSAGFFLLSLAAGLFPARAG